MNEGEPKAHIKRKSIIMIMMMMMMMMIVIIIIIIQAFMYGDTTNVEPETLEYTSNNWSHRNNNKRFNEKFGSRTRKTFN
jgi:flagellar basal body-associated protein FliL